MRVFRLAAALPVGCLVSGGAGYGCGCAVPVYGGCGWLVGGLCVALLVGCLEGMLERRARAGHAQGKL